MRLCFWVMILLRWLLCIGRGLVVVKWLLSLVLRVVGCLMVCWLCLSVYCSWLILVVLVMFLMLVILWCGCVVWWWLRWCVMVIVLLVG